MKTTTLKEIKKAKPCKDGWEELLKSLGKKKADNEELSLEYILKSNGLSDACWVASKVLHLEKELRLFAYWNAKQCKQYVDDKKAYNKVINTVNLYAYGIMGDSALNSARASARSYARSYVLNSAGYSAWNSARDSAWDSTWNSARDSALNSARASARSYAWDSTCASAWASYMKKSDKNFINIVCNGKLPAKVKTKNHF